MVKTEPLIIFTLESSHKFLNLELPSEFVNLFSGPKIKNGNVYFMLSSILTSFFSYSSYFYYHYNTQTGFVHAEDHFWSDGQFNGHGKAWKSISLGEINLK